MKQKQTSGPKRVSTRAHRAIKTKPKAPAASGGGGGFDLGAEIGKLLAQHRGVHGPNTTLKDAMAGGAKFKEIRGK